MNGVCCSENLRCGRGSTTGSGIQTSGGGLIERVLGGVSGLAGVGDFRGEVSSLRGGVNALTGGVMEPVRGVARTAFDPIGGAVRLAPGKMVGSSVFGDTAGVAGGQVLGPVGTRFVETRMVTRLTGTGGVDPTLGGAAIGRVVRGKL